MELETKDAWTGAFLLLTVAVVLGAFAALNKGRLSSRVYPVGIRLSSIAGIERGGEVIYRGYRAGEVDAVTVAYEPNFHFDVRLSLKREIRLREGTTVLVRGKGLGGAHYLELVPPEKPGSGFLGEGALLDASAEPDIFASAQDTLGDVHKMVGDVQKGGTAENLQAAALHMRDAAAKLDATLASLNALLAENRATVKATLEEAHALTADARKLVAKQDEALTQSLENIKQGTSHLPAIMANAEALSADLKRHPWHLVRKGSESDAK